MSAAVAKEDEDAVIQVTSYKRKEVGFPFIRFDAPRFSFIREALRTPFASPAKTDLGGMKNLPVEVLWQIFRPLNIASLLHLRQVNRRARQVVTAMKEYHTVMKYAIHVVLALDTLSDNTPTPAELHDAMGQDPSCTRCGKFGSYVLIWSRDRVCAQCIQGDSHVMGDVYKQLPPERLKRIDEIFMLAAPLPHIKSDTKGQPLRVDHGIYCVGCYIAPEYTPVLIKKHFGSQFMIDLQNCAYSRKRFLEHFKWCPESKALWEASQGGTVAVEVPEFVTNWRVKSAALAE